ncbi:MAG: flagellar biosynthetic protein FliR [Syntrophotaleaceae bacterium]
MQIPVLPLTTVESFLICAARTGALIGSIPIISGGQTPATLRAGLALILALITYPVAAPYIPDHSFTPVSLAILIGQEALLGVMIGIMARLIFTAVEFGGDIIGYQMGFAAANIYDPQNQHQLSLMSQFQNVFAILIFLALDVHHLFFRVMASSYRLLPPGQFDLSAGAVPFLMEMTGRMFSLAVRFSAPILVLLLLSGLVLGIMARIFPQLNVFLLSFPLNIGLALLVIGLTFHMVAGLLSREFAALPERLMHLLELVARGS